LDSPDSLDSRCPSIFLNCLSRPVLVGETQTRLDEKILQPQMNIDKRRWKIG
jgi:hypothetical protein